MSKLNEIQAAILGLDGGQFQKLSDRYIYKKFGYKYIMDYGSHSGTNKTTKGVPDTYFPLENGKYVFVMYGSHENNAFKKIKKDIQDCLNETKTGIEISKIQQIICCHTSSNISPKQDAELRKTCSDLGVLLDIVGIGTISQDLLSYYQIIAREELGVAVDSGQILSIDEFVKAYDENPMVTPIGIGIYGRDTEIKDSLVKIKESKVLMVYGNSGVGKTRLILEVCRTFTNTHKDTVCYCVKNNSMSLYEDLKAFIEINKEYLIFIDDANQTSDLSHLIEYVNKENYKVKIIISVRDYARDRTEKIVKGFLIPEHFLLKPMTNEQINEIMKKELDIINPVYLEHINLIAKGNPRLAILAGRISKNKTLRDIVNIEQLFESYYGRIVEDIDLFQSGTAIRIAGLIAFFNTINLEDTESENIVLHFAGVNRVELSDTVNKLHSMEIVDLFENSAIKISEQSMGNYLLYYVFAKQRLIKISDIVRKCFPAYRQKIIYAFNTIIKLFYTEEISNYLTSEIGIVWDEYAVQGNSNFIEYMKMFYSVRELETLKYLDDIVNQFDEAFYDVTQINFDQLNNNHHVDDMYLNILKGYNHSSNRRVAIELIIKYFKKRPDMFMDFYFCLTDGFGIDRKSYYHDYVVQQDVIDILILETKSFTEHNVNMLFIRVAEIYLKLVFHPTESSDNRRITWYTTPVNCTDGSKQYRKKIWQALVELYPKPGYQDLILKIIEHYKRGASDCDTNMVLFDLENIYAFIRTNLDKSCYKHCRIVKKISNLSSAMPNDIKEFLNNQTFNIYELLKGKRHLEEYDYRKEKELNKVDINSYISNYSIDDFIKLFDFFSEIQLDHSREIWEVNEGLSMLFELMSTQQDIYPDIVKAYIEKDTPLDANPNTIVYSLIKTIGDNEAYQLLTTCVFNQKARWISIYFASLNDTQISEINLERLNEFLFNDETIRTGSTPTLDVLEKFIVLDEQIVFRTTCFLIDRNDINPRQLTNFIRFGLHENKSDFDKLLKYYSVDLSVLRTAYFLSLKCDRHMDYDSWFLRNMLIADSSFLKKFILFTVENDKLYHDCSPSLAVIWLLDNWVQLAWEAVEEYIHLCGSQYWDVMVYLEKLFAYKEFQDNDEDNARERDKELDDFNSRQNIWIKAYIDRYCFDKERIELIFEVISHFSNERRIDFINYFINRNNSFEFFQHLHLVPSSWTASGSIVPLYENRKDFIESLLPLFNGLRFLQHRDLLQQMIESYRKRIKNELRSEFLEER